MRVIITADDLGYNHAVNRRIDELLSAGIITSASINAIAPAFEEGAAVARRHPGASFGVHLNVREFSPLTADEGLRPLLDGEGRFSGKGFTAHLRSKAVRLGIQREWRAQIQAVIAAAVRPCYLDSHQNVHRHLRLLDIAIELCREFGIPAIRRPCNIKPGSRTKGFGGRLNDWNWGRRIQRAGIVAPDAYGPLSWLEAGLPGLRDKGTLELQVHPGFGDYEEETRLLMSGEWKRSLADGFELISYRELPAGGHTRDSGSYNDG